MIHVVMGSLSDKKVVLESGMVEVFDAAIEGTGLGPGFVSYHIISAHRNPDELAGFVGHCTGPAADRPIFVGVAGMAAALPGALAGLSKMAYTIIGVPLDEYGIDSCVYMPPGVPVLTAGVGKAGLKNAAIAALQIVAGRSDPFAQWLAGYIEQTNKLPQSDIDIHAS